MRRSWGLRRRAGIALAIAVCSAPILVSPVAADTVDDQQREVERIADQLDAITDRIGTLDEDHGAALDRKEQLDIEIVALQASVDVRASELGTLQGQLAQIAIDRFTSGGGVELSPLFSDPETYSDAQQRSQLGLVALEYGAADADKLEALVTDLEDEQRALDRKVAEAASLVSVLETKQVEAEQLVAEYEAAYADAQVRLGDLVRLEQERRYLEAVADAEAEYRASLESRSTPVSQVARGGGSAPAIVAAPASSSGTPNAVAASTSSTSSSTSDGDSSASAGPVPSTASDAGGVDSGPPAPPPPSSQGGIAASAAQGQLGVPYRFAASSPGVAFDCSGLTKYAWGRAGVSLPHQSAQQYASTPHVAKEAAQPGDLVFYKAPIGHVGIYIGGGALIHATSPGDVVKVSSVNWSRVTGVSRPG